MLGDKYEGSFTGVVVIASLALDPLTATAIRYSSRGGERGPDLLFVVFF